jgi:hypothetical protein
MLFDLTAIDERARRAAPAEQPVCDFSIVYHLLSFARNSDVRLKVPLHGDAPSIATITDLWPSANWYEREVWDMFGIASRPPALERIPMPWWQPPATRASVVTEMGHHTPEWRDDGKRRSWFHRSATPAASGRPFDLCS